VKRILFACVENANRSQMAEAFARMHGEGIVEAVSAGTRPAAAVSDRAREAMAEVGYDLAAHAPASVADVAGPFDYVITMGCGEECPVVAGVRREDWPLTDPTGLDPRGFRQVRDEIERRVLSLLEEIADETARPAGRRAEAPAG
jgi:protein-tyrosine-phosphatase